TDQQAQSLLAKLSLSSPDEQGFSLEAGLIKLHNKIWVGQNSAIQTKIIAALHASPIGGHSGQKATFQRVYRLFHWKGLKQDVINFVQQCSICQQAKHPHSLPA